MKYRLEGVISSTLWIGLIAFTLGIVSWRKGSFDPELTPLPAIDRFVREYSGRVEVLKKGWRVTVRKIAE